MNNFKFFRSLLIGLVSFYLVTLINTGTAFACDPCNNDGNNHNPGDSWTWNGHSYSCHSCEAVECWNRDTYGSSKHCSVESHPFYGSVCDTSCPFNASGKFTRDNGVAAPSCSGVSAPVVNFNQDTGAFSVQANGVSNTSSVWFHIWSTLNNKDDERILSASNVGGGVWRVTDQLENHPTDQGMNTILVSAYLGANAYSGGSYCGTLVGGIHKATPPLAYIVNPSDPTGGDIRDAFLTIREDINMAISPLTFNVNGSDPFPGTSYNGLVAVNAFRRPCNASTGNCADYGGGHISLPTTTLCPNGANNCSLVTQPWTPTMVDLMTSSRWQLVTTATDKSNYRCSGNAYTAWTNPLQEPWTRCDRNGTNYDRFTVYLNIAPRGYIPVDSVRLNGSPTGTRIVNANVGDSITVSSVGTDSTDDDSYPQNYVSVVSMVRYSLATGYFEYFTQSCAVGSSSCNLNNATWNTAAAAPGTYQLYMKVNDNVGGCNFDNSTESWSGANLPNYLRCDRNAGGSFSNANDVVTVNLLPPAVSVTGTTFITSTGCTADTSGTTGSGSGPVQIVGGSTYTGSITGTNWAVNGIQSGTNAVQVCATMPATASNNYSLSCVQTGATNHTTAAGNCVTLSPAQLINSPINNWRLGFIASPPTSWISVYDGDIFSAGGLNMTLPSVVHPSFEKFILADKDGVTGSGYFQSNSTVSPNSSASGLYESAGGHFDAAVDMTLWPSTMTTSVPSTCSGNVISDNAGFGTLNSSRCYFTETATFNSWAGTSNGTVTYNVDTSNSVVTVYVGRTTDASPVRIMKNIRSAAANERVLFVFLNDVIFDPSLGGDGTLAGMNAEGAFMAIQGKSITVESYNSAATPDTSLVVQGMLISNNRVNLRRNRVTTNNIPSTVVQYSTQMLYNMTTAERASANGNNSGVFTNNVTWYYGN